jgi:hypothetical protein
VKGGLKPMGEITEARPTADSTALELTILRFANSFAIGISDDATLAIVDGSNVGIPGYKVWHIEFGQVDDGLGVEDVGAALLGLCDDSLTFTVYAAVRIGLNNEDSAWELSPLKLTYPQPKNWETGSKALDQQRRLLGKAIVLALRSARS